MGEIAHYTTFETLEKILTSNCFWAKHHRFMNDPKELSHFDLDVSNLIMSALQEYYEEIVASGDWSVQEIFNCKDDIQRAFTHPMEYLKLTFLTCLSRHYEANKHSDTYDSKNGLLSQWRYYSGSRGIAICFEFDDLADIIEKQDKYLRQDIVEVTYEPMKWHSDHLSSMKNFIIALSKGASSMLSEEDISFATSVMSESLRTKPTGYRDEREVRVITVLNKDDEEKIVCGMTGDGSKFPYIKILNTEKKLPIKKIIIGPSKNQNEDEILIELLLKSHEYKNVEILKSEIQVA